MRRILTVAILLATSLSAVAQTDTAAVLHWDGGLDSVVYDDEFQRPSKHPIYYFGNPFCDHFLELKTSVGPEDWAVGITYAYLPEVWGVHVTSYLGTEYNWLLAGTQYRLSMPWTPLDWHLYGSLGITRSMYRSQTLPALEVGVRVGSPQGTGSFCTTSATAGFLTTGKYLFFTVGLGLSISAVAASTILLLL